MICRTRVSNPVDVLTQLALQPPGFAPSRVIGSGTVLDSPRFRYLLSRHCGINIHNVHACMPGEHGDSEFAAWSMTHIGGIQTDQYCPVCGKCDNWMAERAAIEQTVRDAAYHIIDYKGATYFAVGLALVRIVASIASCCSPCSRVAGFCQPLGPAVCSTLETRLRLKHPRPILHPNRLPACIRELDKNEKFRYITKRHPCFVMDLSTKESAHVYDQALRQWPVL